MSDLYTRLLRGINSVIRRVSGHCGGGGHCS